MEELYVGGGGLSTGWYLTKTPSGFPDSGAGEHQHLAFLDIYRRCHILRIRHPPTFNRLGVLRQGYHWMLWANGTGHKAQDSAQEGSESHGEAIAIAEPKTTPEHFCLEHQTPFKQYHRGDNAWYSHKTANGKWCREK